MQPALNKLVYCLFDIIKKIGHIKYCPVCFSQARGGSYNFLFPNSYLLMFPLLFISNLFNLKIVIVKLVTRHFECKFNEESVNFGGFFFTLLKLCLNIVDFCSEQPLLKCMVPNIYRCLHDHLGICLNSILGNTGILLELNWQVFYFFLQEMGMLILKENFSFTITLWGKEMLALPVNIS